MYASSTQKILTKIRINVIFQKKGYSHISMYKKETMKLQCVQDTLYNKGDS